MNIVMNNNYLRKLIFSYFMDKQFVKCDKCKKKCIKEKNCFLRKYVFFYFNKSYLCFECYRNVFLKYQ